MQKCVDKNDRRRCHEGYKYDESKKKCVKSSCPPGQVYRKKYGCVPKCKDNEKYNPSLKKCEPKTKKCPDGFRFDKTQNKCVPKQQTRKCPDGYRFDKAQNRCVPKQQNRKPIRCRYQYNQKTRSCKVLSKEAIYKDIIAQIIENALLDVLMAKDLMEMIHVDKNYIFKN